MNRKLKNVRLAKMAMLVALAVVLVMLIHFPIFPAVAFLEYDPADIPILIGAFAFGPLAGVLLTVIASLIQGLTVSAASGAYSGEERAVYEAILDWFTAYQAYLARN